MILLSIIPEGKSLLIQLLDFANDCKVIHIIRTSWIRGSLNILKYLKNVDFFLKLVKKDILKLSIVNKISLMYH